MKKYKRLFLDAERIVPPPGLWGRIQAQVGMGDAEGGLAGWDARNPWLRVAASVLLAAGLLTLGLSLEKRSGNATASGGAATGEAAPAMAEAENNEFMELVDPELLGWHAELGEIDEVAEQAEEVL